MHARAAPDRIQRWAPWVIGAVVAAVYAAIGPRGDGATGTIWDVIASVARAVPIGDAADRVRFVGAVCAGGAAVMISWLVMAAGGADAAAIAGAVAAAAVMAGSGPWAQAAAIGPVALASGLALAAIGLGERIATGGGAWPGIGAGVVAGSAIAMDRGAVVLVPGLVALWAIRLRHGARWAAIAPMAGAIAWAVAMIPVWHAGGAEQVTIDGAPHAIDLADAVGAIAAVAGAAGLVVLVSRRRTRWLGGFAVALVVGGIAIERLGGHAVGPLPVVGLALAAGAGVARLARLAGPGVGQACVGGAAAVIVAVPVVLAAI